MFSRHKKVLNKRFPAVVNALASLGGDFVLDGELVALDSQGKPSFQLLQATILQSHPIYFYAFDLLHQNGKPLVNLPFPAGAGCSKTCLPRQRIRCACLHCCRHHQEILKAVRKLGLEGIVGKRIDSIYEPGERSGAWIKLRTNMEQEFVIGGYIPGARGFDALLVGVYEGKRLIFTAKVKNGFVPRIRDDLFPALKALQTCSARSRICPRRERRGGANR